MAQQAARAEFPPPSTDLTVVQKLDDLGRDWTVLRECRLRPSDRGSSPTILIHPVRGIAVLDVSPSATPDAVEAVRARLGAARFEGIFAGHLPVVHLRATPRQMPSLPQMLDDAFAALPPLSLPGCDAWAGVAARALLAEQPAARRVEPQPSRGTVEDNRRRRRTRRRRRSALRKAGAVLLCLAALGGVVAMVLKEAPLSDAFTRVAAPPVAAVAPSAPLPPPLESATPRGVAALPALPHTPEPAFPPPTLPAPSGGRTAAPIPDVSSLTPPSPPGEAAAPEAPQRAAPTPPPRRAETPPQQTRKPAERAAAPQSQRRQQEAVADPPSTGGAAPPSDTASQRCSRIAARIGSGAALGEADMRFFNQACIRW